MSTKDWLEKDFYKVLGVSKDASDAEIKKAFHKIARENHPDAHPGDVQAEQRFKEASEAHAVLSDPKQRKDYDETRSAFGGPFGKYARGAQQAAGNVNLEDLFARTRLGGDAGGFGDILGGLFGGGQRSSSRGPRRGADIEGEVSIDFRQAIDGTTIELGLSSDAACTVCQGTGARPGSSPRPCTTCHGSGTTQATSGGVFAMSEPCRDCRGRGLLIDDPCVACQGAGRGTSTRSIQVRIPAGVSDGQKIRVKGKGSVGSHGGANGDLYVLVHVAHDEVFGRNGKNLTVTVPISFPEASLGAEISVPTLDGRTNIRIPAGTPSGRTFRVRGKGVQASSGTAGDLLVTVEITVPPSINEEARQALEAYQRALGHWDPRENLR